MLSHSNVAKAFANGSRDATGSRIFIEGNKIYSYGRHFVIAKRIGENEYVFNTDGYSSSTGKHKSHVFSHICNDKNTVWCSPGARIENIEYYTIDEAKNAASSIMTARKYGRAYVDKFFECRDTWKLVRKRFGFKNSLETKRLFNLKLKRNEKLLVKMVEWELKGGL